MKKLRLIMETPNEKHDHPIIRMDDEVIVDFSKVPTKEVGIALGLQRLRELELRNLVDELQK